MKNRKRLYYLILILIPILFFVLLEAGLRLFDAFAPEPLFVDTWQRGEKVYQLNTQVARRYFNPGKMTLPTLYPETIRVDKQPHTFRIFCLGGSTTAGFPFDAQVPFPQQLKYLLTQAHPNTEFEVINLGLSAINSYSVLDLLPEVLDKQPDLIVVYMGHNEFYGAYGSASAISIGQNRHLIRLTLWLQKFHFINMLKSLLFGWMGESEPPDSDQTLMEQVSADRAIPYESEKYQRTMANFRANYKQLIQTCQQADVPLMVGTLVSNVADLPPFASEVTPISAQQQATRTKADDFRQAAQMEKSLRLWQVIVETYDPRATDWYGLGQALAAAGDSSQALLALNRARDLDLVRFRASSDANEIITDLSRQHNVPQVDMPQIFRALSPAGLIGADLMCDHLHPNPRGYYLMAHGFYERMHQAQFLSDPDTVLAATDGPFVVTDLDWDIGLMKIWPMIHRWPFPAKSVTLDDFPPYGDAASARIAREFVFQHHNWQKAHYDMADVYFEREAYVQAEAEYRAVQWMFPHDAEPYRGIARTYKAREMWPESAQFYKMASQRQPGDGMLLYQLAVAQWQAKALPAAIESMRAAIAAPGLSDEQKLNARYYLAGFLGEAGNFTAAKDLAREILRERPGYAPVARLFQQLEAAEAKAANEE